MSKSPETIRKHHCYLRADFYDETEFSAPAEGPVYWHAADQMYIYEGMDHHIHCRTVENAKRSYHDPELGRQWERYQSELRLHLDNLIAEFTAKAESLGLRVEFKNCEGPYIKNKKFRPSETFDRTLHDKIEAQMIEEHHAVKRGEGELIQGEDFTLLWNCTNNVSNARGYLQRVKQHPMMTVPFTVVHGDNKHQWFGRCTSEAADKPEALWAEIQRLMGDRYKYENVRIVWSESELLKDYEWEAGRRYR